MPKGDVSVEAHVDHSSDDNLVVSGELEWALEP